jgi:hypothetical protein
MVLLDALVDPIMLEVTSGYSKSDEDFFFLEHRFLALLC